jgi:isoleucyl-tRNA synthetase
MHEPVDGRPSFPALEVRILEWWKAEDIPGRGLTFRKGAPEWVFYEGPPYVNAPPGVHSVMPRVIKDVYTRFQTMKGHFVPRKGGWDCHGLPAEVNVEKQLGFTHKREIVDFGIEKFNNLCRTSVSEYIAGYVKFSERIAFWLDYEDAYETYSNEYIESVWWSLAELHGRGLLFETERVAPYCPRCETPLSDHELGMDDVYQEVSDPGVTLVLPLTDAPVDLEGASLAVWTTTPWTLIANLAAAVGPDITYAVVEHEGKKLILAEALIATALGVETPPPVLRTVRGSELAGLHYRPPFEYAKRALGDVDAWKVLSGDFVDVGEGTGIVHMAGAFGQDDLLAVRAAGIPIYNPVNASGNFDRTVPEYEGTFIRDADERIIDELRTKGVLVRSESHLHSYMHCWRCKSPLFYYALVSWYIRTSEKKQELLAANEGVNWVPEHIKKGRYGNWLENNVDWSLSRFRFWGTPLPIWRCPNSHDVAIGSVEKLSDLAGRDLAGLDLHRPYVDDVTFPCPECNEESKRIPDVIDVWYDSGAMPFAQYGYPHRNQDLFEQRFPADFICEALDQTRGWFYSLMAESVLLFGENAYRNVICHGLLLDDEGKKFSKSRAIADPWAVFGTFGSDALRFFYLSAGDVGANRRLSEDALQQIVRGPFLTLWNVYRLYVLYANIDRFDPNDWELIAPQFRPAIDRWILSELSTLVFEVDGSMENFDALTASRRIVEFIDDLSNWYVRRSRRRFWRAASDDEAVTDKAAAYWTLWTCLVELSKLLAPFAPFLSEELYRNLVVAVNEHATPSVHLTDFPAGDPQIVDPRLAAGMAAVRELASLGHSARADASMKVRQPLGRALLLVPEDLQDAVEEVADILADELNVDELEFAHDASDLVRVTLRPNFRTAGPDFGPRVQALASYLSSLDAATCSDVAATFEDGMEVDIELPATDGGVETAGGLGGSPTEVIRVGPEHVEIRREPAEGTAFAYEPPFGISLDLEITPELRREGFVREFVHLVQGLRRDAGLDVTDRISLVVAGPDDALTALREHETDVAEELLATSVDIAGGPGVSPGASGQPGESGRVISVDGTDVTVAIAKADAEQ